MPYLLTNKVCTRCQETNKLFRYRWHGQNQKHCFVSICKDCENNQTKKHQQENREYWRELNRRSYLNWTNEQKTKRLIESHKRHKRLRQVFWDQELTDLVTEEAHDLRLRLNKLTNTEWHVDHIIPLNRELVSGLHVWNNLQVIPKNVNLAKRNKYAISEERKEGLQT